MFPTIYILTILYTYYLGIGNEITQPAHADIAVTTAAASVRSGAAVCILYTHSKAYTEYQTYTKLFILKNR